MATFIWLEVLSNPAQQIKNNKVALISGMWTIGNIRLTQCRTQWILYFRNWNPIENSLKFRRRSLMTGYLTFNWVSQGFLCNGLCFSPNCRFSQLANLATIVVVATCWSTTTPGQQQTTSASNTQYYCNVSVSDEVTRMRKIRDAQGAPWQSPNKPGERKKYSGSWVGYTGCSRITWTPRLGY